MRLAALLALVALAAPTLSLAQEQTAPPADAPKHSEGTKPENRGSTGWGGGAREPEGKEATGSVTPAERSEAAGQPPLASGSDLKGPPQQFPPSKTPE